MPCAQCRGIVQEFDDRFAGRDLRRYRRRGPLGTTRRMLEGLLAAGVRGRTFLDVGGGVGVLAHELLAAGARSGMHVDASAAYVSAAREEARRRGTAERVTFMEGDFVALSSHLGAFDMVMLDRVVCCYPDMPALVDASASCAHRVLALAFPREHLFMRISVGALNLIQRLRRRPFRVFLHGPRRIEARVRAHGFRPLRRERSPLWHIHLYIKEGERGDGLSPVSA